MTSLELQAEKDFKLSVSSVINRDTKQFGKKNLTDDDDETCWNSDEGSLQWINCVFAKPTTLSALSIQFQGGFAAKKLTIQLINGSQSDPCSETTVYPEDSNLVQHFALDNSPQTGGVKSAKLLLENCSDMFGRVIVYKFKLFGSAL